MSDKSLISQQLKTQFRLFRDNPSNMIEAGLIKIVSPFQLDEKGNLVEKPPGSDFQSVFRPNKIQKILDNYTYVCRKNKRKAVARILKSRSVGGSVYIQSRIVSTICTRSHAQCLTVAHRPRAAQNIYKMGHRMIKSLPDWLRPNFRYESAEYMETENPLFGIRHSGTKNLPATENIESARSDRFLIMHFSECSQYEDPDAFEAATGALGYATHEAEEWWETTANGQDPCFHPRFMDDWERQGKLNIWEPGHRLFRGAGTAFFFPWYLDTAIKILKLEGDAHPDELEATMDSYEKALYHEKIFPMWMREAGGDEKTARLRSLEQLHWRRSKIPGQYPHWPSGVPHGSTYTSIINFQREEPATVEEAFVSTVGRSIFTADCQRRLQDSVRPPIKTGLIVNGEFQTFGEKYLRIWKGPDEVKDVSLSVDPSEGMVEPTAIGDDSRDYTYAVMFDRITGEQVASYQSQEPQHIVAKHLYELAKWYAKRGGDEAHPYFCSEVQYGKVITRYFIDRGYPMSRMYFRQHEERVGRQPISLIGWSNHVASKRTAVQAMLEAVEGGTRIIRDENIANQAAHFIEVKPGTYQAVHKGKGGATSKDDAILALAIDCHCDKFGVRPVDVEMSGNTYGDDEGYLPSDIGSEDISKLVKVMEWASENGINYMDLQEKGSENSRGEEVLC